MKHPDLERRRLGAAARDARRPGENRRRGASQDSAPANVFDPAVLTKMATSNVSSAMPLWVRLTALGLTLGLVIFMGLSTLQLGNSLSADKDGEGKALLSATQLDAARVDTRMDVARTALENGCGRFEWSVLDWNEPAIRVYQAIGAEPMSEWTRYRLSGDALAAFAAG